MKLTYNDYKKQLKEICDRYSNKTAVTYMRNTGEDDILSYSDMYSFIIDSVQK